jgi:hypothetical protein
LAIEKVERVESPDSGGQGSTVSVVFDRDQPDYVPNFDPADLPEKDDDDTNLANARTGIVAVLLAWRDRERLIDVNPNLTAVGKADAKARALPEFEERFKPLEKVIAAHDDRLLEEQRDLAIPDFAEPTDAAGATRAAELRRWFSEQPKGGPRGQVDILRHALEENNRELLSAIVHANPAMGLVDQKVRDALITALVERTYPEAVTKLATRQRRVDVAMAALERVRELMRGDTPKPIRERLIVGRK